MSQLILDLNSINKTRATLLVDYNAGNLSKLDYLDYDLKYLKEAASRENGIVQLVVSAAKHGKRILNAADSLNLLDKHVSINTGNPEIEMIKCPDKDNCLVTRQECLDYSGSNTETCKSCPQFGPTRRALLPDS